MYSHLFDLAQTDQTNREVLLLACGICNSARQIALTCMTEAQFIISLIYKESRCVSSEKMTMQWQRYFNKSSACLNQIPGA